MLYIETVEPDCVVLTDSPRFMEGRRACLDRRRAGAVLAVLADAGRERVAEWDDFTLAPAAGGGYSYEIEGGGGAFPAADASVLRHALEQACLTLCRTRT